jgi:hypothetical protein
MPWISAPVSPWTRSLAGVSNETGKLGSAIFGSPFVELGLIRGTQSLKRVGGFTGFALSLEEEKFPQWLRTFS